MLGFWKHRKQPFLSVPTILRPRKAWDRKDKRKLSLPWTSVRLLTAWKCTGSGKHAGKWDRGGSFYQECKFTVHLWLLTDSCSDRNSLPATNTLASSLASPSFCLSLTPSFWKSGAKRYSQSRCFKTPLTVSFLCPQLSQCSPSCTRNDSEVLCGQKVFSACFS